MSSSDKKDDGSGGAEDRSSEESEIKIKEEPDDVMMDVDGSPPPAFGPAALGLHPVGTKFPEKTTPTQPVQALNARGMPARIRKKNKLFFDDDLLINDRIPPKGSPRKGGTPGPNGTGFAEPWESRDAFRLSGILAGELYDGWTRLFAELFCAVCVCEK
ncbi:hypothetical protein RP20_CCG008457 [Aedes albopictus]|nr:hypothetical protein RP20_CCG008457 [Aedes albopictus]